MGLPPELPFGICSSQLLTPQVPGFRRRAGERPCSNALHLLLCSCTASNKLAQNCTSERGVSATMLLGCLQLLPSIGALRLLLDSCTIHDLLAYNGTGSV